MRDQRRAGKDEDAAEQNQSGASQSWQSFEGKDALEIATATRPVRAAEAPTSATKKLLQSAV
ncbi:MAG: hypothetical protein WDN29_06225 [Methylovirgula sp.]